MQDMIKRIVEMDQKAQNITTEAQSARLEAEKDIAKRRQQIHDDLLDRARQRLRANEETERKLAEEAWQTLCARQETVARKLDDDYAKNGDRWVRDIVARVLGA